jgi:hypothetical protein
VETLDAPQLALPGIYVAHGLSDHYVLVLDQAHQQAEMRCSRNYMTPMKAAIGRSNQFAAKVHHGKVEIELNGKTVFAAYELIPEVGEGSKLIGLGAHFAPPGAAVRFTELKVRRLQQGL